MTVDTLYAIACVAVTVAAVLVAITAVSALLALRVFKQRMDELAADHDALMAEAGLLDDEGERAR